MPKGYWIVCYRSVTDKAALADYAAAAKPVIEAGGGRFLVRGMPARTYENGLGERTIVIEFESLTQALATYDSPDYQAALACLGNTAERDVRFVEGS